tara:strand:- start:69563 stop:70738 length:1176 start_codon:yes stop_codon:yes gene_type:complete
MSPKIEKVIVKYITKSATANDLDILSEWIKTPSNKQMFKDYVQTHYAITYNMNNPDEKAALEQLLQSIKKEQSLIYKMKNKPIYKYIAAASVIGLMMSAYFFKDDFIGTTNNIQNKTPEIVNSIIEPGTDKAMLTLEDGSQIDLEKNTTVQMQNASSNGKEIIYKPKKGNQQQLEYNYITIPRGGQFFIKLEDGTEVWLNSETKIKYPVSFIEGATREVELMYGEAYFDVSPSTRHKGAGFKVINGNQEIHVLGTEFNIKAYKDETNVFTTLVEGKVDVDIARTKKSLIPNQRLTLDITTKNTIIKTVDVYNEISWKDGVFSFEEKTLKEIMKVLSRWYDMEVVFKNQSIEDEYFVGILRKNQSIEEILNSIKNFGVIKNFEIEEKKVIIE